jgi:enamine deaminase RidA (YjgF/YER057c/UK114 family)
MMAHARVDRGMHPAVPPVWRRFAGVEAEEIHIQCRPDPRHSGDIARQTASIYDACGSLLQSERGSLEHVVHQVVFFRNIQRDLKPFQKAFLEIYRTAAGTNAPLPATTLIEQPPLDTDADLALSATAVLPHFEQPEGPGSSASLVGRSFVLGDQRHLYAASIHGAPGNAFDETASMFLKAEEVLAQHGMSFQDVCRTWIYLRHMERDYAEFNRGRREFFRSRNVSLLPASTGIHGSPYPERANLMLSFYAIKSPRPIEVSAMNTPTLNEACVYGADFSRGLRVVDGNKIALYISGTASVDEEGRTAHAGNFAAQVDRMLLNVETLLSAQNAAFRNILSAITYLKSADDSPLLRRILEDRGLGTMPNVVVHAAVCRPDLLCEMEAVAALPKRIIP